MATLRCVLLKSTLACCNGDVFVGVAVFDGVVDLGIRGVDLAFMGEVTSCTLFFGVPCCNGDVFLVAPPLPLFFGVSC